MTAERLSQLRSLEGRRINVALHDGSRIDDCELVSIGRNRIGSLWLFTNGEDAFVTLDDVVDLWERAGRHQRVA
ncbi:MAG TPA: hypothetical protein VLL25_03635 [Acidimicrobiales bacterium]|nr:hypothetical protein [Acidimicrobiales bacterium]